MQTLPTILEYADIQGLVLRGYRQLPEACYYLLHITNPAGFKTWLAERLDKRRVTAADVRPSAAGGAFNIAFTPSGLFKLGVNTDPNAQNRDGFALEFRQGMTQPDRSAFLGDVDRNDPRLWLWSDRAVPAASTGSNAASVDCLFLTFAASLGKGISPLDLWSSLDPGAQVATVLFVMPAWLDAHGKEAFGFRDGLSQPILRYTAREYASVGAERQLHVVEPGEFLLGYENEIGRMPISPSVPPELDPKGRLRPLENRLRRDDRSFASNLRDFGRNGSYMVVRQLKQDVAAFQQFLSANASDRAGQDRLAAALVGRWKNGAPLSRFPTAQPAEPGDNNFAYFADDRYGYRCPPGAHVRRANPRDALAPDDPGTEHAIERANTHRLLRRARRFGPRADTEAPTVQGPGQTPPGDQGLVFIALNANLRGQFEFVQQTWLNNQKFAGLDGERDPLNGCPAGPYTIRNPEAGHQRLTLKPFVTVIGGGYFFMPGLAALRCLAD